MRIAERVDVLKKQLLLLGFAGGLEQELLSELCFLPETFTIDSKRIFFSDTVVFTFHFEIVKAGNEYRCKFYDAVLRKQISFTDAGLLYDQCISLDEKMQQVDWELLKPGAAIAVETAAAVEVIVQELQQLSSMENGKEFADRLRLRYWQLPHLAHRFTAAPPTRNKFEINQRFYFFEDEPAITIDEAYRFLNNKWMEKKFQAKKSQVESSAAVSDEPGGGAAGMIGKKQNLLPKKGRRRKL